MREYGAANVLTKDSRYAYDNHNRRAKTFLDLDGDAFLFHATTERFVYDGLSDDLLYRYNPAGAKQSRYVH